MEYKLLLPLLAALAGGLNSLHAQTTAFTYQGKLVDDCCPATGLYDLTFKLFDNTGPGASGQQGSTFTTNRVSVTNGLFTVSLDFGSAPFTGARRWLQLDVRTNNAALPFVTLNPRTELTGTPYAIHAATASTVPDNAITRPKIATGQVVKSLNGLTDAISLVAGNNVTLTPSGNSLQISAASGTFTLPYSATESRGVPLFSLQNDGGIAISGFSPSSWGIAGASLSGVGVVGNSAGGGYAVYGEHTDSHNRGYLGTREDGVVGAHNSSGNVGRLGTATRGVYGAGYGSGSDAVFGSHSPSGNVGVLASPTFGTYGAHAVSGNYGQLGTGSYGVYGRAGSAGYGVAGEGQDIGVYAHNTSSGKAAYLATPGLAGDFYGDVFVHGTTTTGVLTITGGADIVEKFPLSEQGIRKGAVVALDPENPGRLKMSQGAYDKRVAGIVSGANGVNHGLALSQAGVLDQGEPVALTGRVYVLADAANGEIEPGDMLTSSDLPGHAMKATDPARSFGAVLGKATTPLKEGTGFVQVLVSLQ